MLSEGPWAFWFGQLWGGENRSLGEKVSEDLLTLQSRSLLPTPEQQLQMEGCKRAASQDFQSREQSLISDKQALAPAALRMKGLLVALLQPFPPHSASPDSSASCTQLFPGLQALGGFCLGCAPSLNHSVIGLLLILSLSA